ncbi:MAG: leucyl aminopeptidase [Chloroflexi bacterium]|nr:leucyl aminopeptidase [Chloroflexota bacterium]
MDIKVVTGNIVEQKTDAIIVNLFEGVDKPAGATGAVDKALGGLITRLIASGEIKGKSKESTLIHTQGRMVPERVLVMGLGKQKDLKLDTIRSVAAEACHCLKQIGVKTAATIVHGAGVGGIDPEPAAGAIAEGSLLGLYEYRQFMTTPPDRTDPTELLIVERAADRQEALERGAKRGVISAGATKLARDMGNEPSNIKTPARLAEMAMEIARSCGLEATVFDKKQMTEMGMGCLLGVAQGSAQEPRLIVLTYRGDPARKDTLGLVGKGITFDTGGISIKPDDGMREMKTDMAGGAVVIAVMKALAQLKPGINVTGIVPAVENMPDGAALKPGDVIRAMNGKTVEVISTDAEGRLILADAILYGKKLGLAPIIDIATLTGGMRITLGDVCTGAFTNDQQLVTELIAAGEQAGEYIWQFPMFEEYKEDLKSEVADVANHGGRGAGSIKAAHFLAEFVESTPWVHLDIASTARSEKDKSYIQKGATGVSVRTLVNFVLARAARNGK